MSDNLPVPLSVPNYLPSNGEFDTICRMADVLSNSALVPANYRRNPANIILASMAGRPFGWDPTMSMRSFHVIEGVPTLKPEILLALVRSRGHSVQGESGPTGATITGRRADTGDTLTVTFTLDDAKRANLLNKSVWKQYPADMCWARALSALCRRLFSDVVLGCGYTPEEIEDVPQLATPGAPGGPVGEAAAPSDELVAFEAEYKPRAMALPETEKAEFVAHWKAQKLAWARLTDEQREAVADLVQSLEDRVAGITDAELVEDDATPQDGADYDPIDAYAPNPYDIDGEVAA